MDGDGDFSSFAAARWDSLVRAAVVLGCDLDEAHDLAQTTLLRCYLSWRRVQRADDRDAYVYKMLVNSHRDSRRRRWWGERPSDELPEIQSPDASGQVDVTDAVHRALRGLSRAHREVVVLRFYANLSEQQVSEHLGIAPGTVKSRLSRALAILADNTHLTDLSEGHQ